MVKATENEKTKNEKRWVNFVKLKRADWEPSKHSAVFSECFRKLQKTIWFGGQLWSLFGAEAEK